MSFPLECSEDIRGEILFVLYRASVLQYASVDAEGTDLLFAFCPKLLRLSLEALIKTQSDDVRLNCVGLFSITSSFSCLFSITSGFLFVFNYFWVFVYFQLNECHLLSNNSCSIILV